MSDDRELLNDGVMAAFVSTLQDSAGPLADEQLLSRIQQSRRDGVRVLLPNGEEPTGTVSAPSQRWMWVAAAAAALVVVPTVWSAWRDGDRARDRFTADRNSATLGSAGQRDSNAARSPSNAQSNSGSPTNSSNGISQLLMPWPQVAYAQSPGMKREAAYAPVTGMNASRLTAGRRTYLRSSAGDYHTMLPHEIIETETSRTTFRGIASWRVVSTSPSFRMINEHTNGRSWSYDTLWLRSSDLRPIERRYHVGDFMQIVQRFTDSTFAEIDSIFSPHKANQRARVLPQPPGSSSRLDTARVFVHTEATMRLLLRSLPLAEGWRGSVSVPRTSESRVMLLGTPTQYLNLRVAGTDSVQTYSGRFACWRVLLDTGPKPDVWYVSQETGETILTEGAYGPSYPESQLRLLYGYEETRRIAPVRVR